MTDAPTPPPHRPRKRFGQHFLHDRRVLERIADALALDGTETVVEIGPGEGALTELLAARAARVIAIELDRDLAARLRTRFASAPTVDVIEGDVLAISLPSVAGPDYVVAGNVPYYITTPILFHVLARPRPKRSVFLVQREVAERVVAKAGSAAYGALSANVQAVAEAEIVGTVGRGAFRPAPTVDSAILRLRPLPHPIVAPQEEERFRRLVIDAFGQRRKQMRRVLRGIRDLSADAADGVLDRAGIAPDARPETLTPAAFVALVRALG